MFLSWFLCGILSVIIFILCVKLRILQKTMDEICTELDEHLSQDTNVLISISSSDQHARHLAAELNRQLRLLRKQRLQYFNGDRELKEAVTNISHDLRTPLTAICGYLDLLEQEEKSEDALRYLSFIKNRTEAMRQLTEELFQYSIIASSTESIVFEDVCLNSALEESFAAYYTAFKEKGITPDIQMPEVKILRQLDKSSLSRIFGNVLNNALKYSDGDLRISLSETGEIIFSNTAFALDEIQVGMLFNRFYTVHTAKNSTGLGLAISRTLMEQMGGKISAQYKENKLIICLSFPDTIPLK